jgi:phosphate transport system permease protein
VNGEFGAWPFIWGTLFTSFLALALAVPTGFAVALFLTELAPTWIRAPLGVLVELLAGVPSIVYGMWGLFVLAPLLRKPIEPWLKAHLGWISLFNGPAIGLGFLLAGIVLAVMILPTITAIARDALAAIPRLEREAAYALGATRWEVSRSVLRSAKAGLFAAATLGLGRALGETIAVTLVIGNVPKLSARLFDPGQTIASTLATQIGEASDPLFVSALIGLGLVLFVLTLAVNLGARLVIERPWRKHA